MASATISESAVSLNVNPNAPTGPVLKMVNGVPMVSSHEVADHFGKRHADLLRSIKAIFRNSPEGWAERNFAFSEYEDSTGRKLPQADLTRDGFVVVAMGFTGKKAILWKIRYVQAFNAMEAELSGQYEPSTGTILPAQQQELKELVQAKASAYPDALKRKVFSQIWTRLQRKFKVPRYEELPVAVFGEARDYVIAMQLRGAEPASLPEAEPAKSLPSARRRNTLDDYKAMYRELPDSPQHWLRLITETFNATEAFGKKLEAIKAEATRPFRSGRTSDVSSYFDASMSPVFDLFSVADEQLRLTYRCVYNALEGCRNTWLLLNKG